MNPAAEYQITLSQSYKRTLNGEVGIMAKLLTPLLRRFAYKRIFNLDSLYAGIVMNDLRTFCGGTGSKWGATSRDTERMVARNEVYERIRKYVNISEADITKQYDLYEKALENFDD